jgi:hypothetical protein
MTYATALAVEVVNGNPAERILVIAANYRQFTRWCGWNRISPLAPNVRCATRDQDLRGYSDTWYAFLGVPDGREGLLLLHLFEHMKATRGFKNAGQSTGSSDGPHA